MSLMTTKLHITATGLVSMVMTAAFLLATNRMYAAAPGIKGSNFHLTAQASLISQPDGAMIYSWGYGCADTTSVTFAHHMPNNNFPTMQVPGPTLIVTENTQFTVTLTNGLPAAAGSTSILFP